MSAKTAGRDQPRHRGRRRQGHPGHGRRCGQPRSAPPARPSPPIPRPAARSASTCSSGSSPSTRSASSDMAKAITEEMGAPSSLAQRAQAADGHRPTSRRPLQVLKDYKFEEDRGTTRLVKEPIGVCAFITPWNWPVNQIACKVAPGPGHRLHHGAQALGSGPVLGLDLDRDPACRRRAGRGLQPGQRRRPGGGRGAQLASRKSTWCRSPARPGPASRWRKQRRPDRQARAPGAGRQEPQHHPRRRRLPEGGGAAAWPR